MDKLNIKIKQYSESLRLTLLKNSVESTIHQAQIDKPSYLEYTHHLLEREVKQRQKIAYERRLKMAQIPLNHNLDDYDFNFSSGISKPELKQLRELIWLEQNYNVVLMGPSGTGKSYLASGLVYEAVKRGYKSYFLTMEELVTVLKLKEMTSSALNKYNRLLKAHLIAIDDIMMFPIKKHEAVAFFNLINHLHEKSSVIITTELKRKFL
ncbi:MAG: ATP-binding protein [Bacteroidales bacterium]|nr:ATP-binding protein [Bacteroidales bacterium]